MKKKHVLNIANAALRRFVTVWKNQTGHTHNYCNPAAHALACFVNNV